MGSENIIADTAKEETTRQTIILVFSVLGTAGMLYVLRKFDRPDAGRTIKMAGALKVKRFANKQVDFWQNIADKAATTYQRERL